MKPQSDLMCPCAQYWVLDTGTSKVLPMKGVNKILFAISLVSSLLRGTRKGHSAEDTNSISSRVACSAEKPDLKRIIGGLWVSRGGGGGKGVLCGRISHGLGSHLDPENHQTLTLCV